MKTITFDTNVLVSSIMSSEGTSYQLFQLACLEKINAYTSIEILNEFKRVIQRDLDLSEKEAEEKTEIFLRIFKLIEPTIKLNLITEDPDDNKILECAVESNSDYLASWDPHLTNLKQYKNIKIINPGKILAELKNLNEI